MAQLVFFSGTMDSGKSTLALQTDHNFRARGREGLIYSRGDRAGADRVSSRLGLEVAAVEVTDDTDFLVEIGARRAAGQAVDYLVCDEAQFYSPAQVEQLARLVELADRVELLQVQSLCWCGARATHNARTVDGIMVTEGEQVVIGDVGLGEVAYEVLCRRHHMRRMTALTARRRSADESLWG